MTNIKRPVPISTPKPRLAGIGLSVSVSDQLVVGSFDPVAAFGVAANRNAEQVEASFQIALDQQNYGHEPRLRLQPTEPDRAVKDDRLVELLGRAFAAREELLEMDENAARSVRTTKLCHLQRLARISYLDPKIIRGILSSTQPKNLGARSLWRMGDLPIRFADQREALGFSNS